LDWKFHWMALRGGSELEARGETEPERGHGVLCLLCRVQMSGFSFAPSTGLAS
jgi:hypothetical protein